VPTVEVKKFDFKDCVLYHGVMQQFLKNKIDITKWLDEHNITDYRVLESSMVDVSSDVNLRYFELEYLPVKFHRVCGYFNCSNNALTSLLGAPQMVSGDFNCNENKLTSLLHAPRVVGKSFMCSGNELTSLEHAPTLINEDFYCGYNRLESLQFCPVSVNKNFVCVANSLVDLYFCPTYVGEDFKCDKNPKLGELQKVKNFSKIDEAHHVLRAIRQEQECLSQFLSQNNENVNMQVTHKTNKI